MGAGIAVGVGTVVDGKLTATEASDFRGAGGEAVGGAEMAGAGGGVSRTREGVAATGADGAADAATAETVGVEGFAAGEAVATVASRGPGDRRKYTVAATEPEMRTAAAAINKVNVFPRGAGAGAGAAGATGGTPGGGVPSGTSRCFCAFLRASLIRLMG